MALFSRRVGHTDEPGKKSSRNRATDTMPEKIESSHFQGVTEQSTLMVISPEGIGLSHLHSRPRIYHFRGCPRNSGEDEELLRLRELEAFCGHVQIDNRVGPYL